MLASSHTTNQTQDRDRFDGISRRSMGAVSRPFDLFCASCGYGVVVRIAPERCPMCSGSTWVHPAHTRPPGVDWESAQPEAA